MYDLWYGLVGLANVKHEPELPKLYFNNRKHRESERNRDEDGDCEMRQISLKSI